MKRFKYYQTSDRLFFQDNLKDKLIAITDNGIIRFKQNYPINANKLFQLLNWKERGIVLNEIEYEDIYTIGSEDNTEFLCDVFESDFKDLLNLNLIHNPWTDESLVCIIEGNYSDFIGLKENYETIFKYSINHFLNS